MNKLFQQSSKLLPVALAIALLAAGCNSGPIEPPISLVPTVLDASYFSSNTDIHLTDNTDLTVDYIVEGVGDVTGKLTIDPGVVIEFAEDAGLDILDNGSISAVGTEALPIILTAESKVPGFWRGVQVQSNSVLNQIEYVTISYGGGEAFNSNDMRGNLILWPESRLSADNCTLINSGSYGVNIGHDVEVPSFTDNVLTDNQTAGYLHATTMNVLDESNEMTGNDNDYVEVLVGDLNPGTVTIENIGIPYRVVPCCSGIFRDLGIVNGVNMIIAPGVEMEFDEDCGLYIQEGSSFRAVGNTTEPIIFTGVNKIAGAWRGLYFSFTNSPNNLVENARIEYAGSGDADAAIYMWADPNLAVNNVEIYDIDGCAFTSGSGAANPNFNSSNVDAQRVTGGVECF